METIPHLTEEMIYTWLDGETLPEEAAQIEAHLAACADCTARRQAAETLFAEITAAPPAPLPHDLRAGVLAAIRPAPVANNPPWMRIATVLQFAAAVALLVLAGIPFAADINGFAAAVLDLLEMWAASLAGWPAAFDQILARWTAVYETLPPLPELPAIDPVEVLELTLTLMPIVLASGLLWLVGNGILIRSLRGRSAK